MIHIEQNKMNNITIHLQGIDVKYILEKIGLENCAKYFGKMMLSNLIQIKDQLTDSNKYHEHVFDISSNSEEQEFYKFILALLDKNILFSRNDLLDKTELDLKNSVVLLGTSKKSYAYAPVASGKKYNQADFEYQMASYKCALLTKKLEKLYNDEKIKGETQEIKQAKLILNYMGYNDIFRLKRITA